MTDSASVPIGADRPPTVLLVDDEELNRKLARAYLAADAYEILEAADGEAALASLERASVDVVVLDLMMPGMSGLGVLERMKAEPAWASIPVVMVSAIDEHRVRREALERGADAFLDRPIDGLRLQTGLRRLLCQRRLGAELARERRRSEAALARHRREIAAHSRTRAELEQARRAVLALVEEPPTPVEAVALGPLLDEVCARAGAHADAVVERRLEVESLRTARAPLRYVLLQLLRAALARSSSVSVRTLRAGEHVRFAVQAVEPAVPAPGEGDPLMIARGIVASVGGSIALPAGPAELELRCEWPARWPAQGLPPDACAGRPLERAAP